jgi:hypothetical protein
MALPPAATLVTVAAVIVTVVALATTAVVLARGGGSGNASPPTTVPPGVPAGWPADVPLIDGAEVVSGQRVDSPDGPFLGVTLRVPDLRAAYVFYRDALRAAGFTLIEDSAHETAFAFFANLFAMGSTQAVNVLVDGQADTVTVAISPRAG